MPSHAKARRAPFPTSDQRLAVLLTTCSLSRLHAAHKLPIGGYKPANVLMASSVRSVTHDPMDTASFFFSFDSVLPERASKPVSDGLPSWELPSLKKTLAVPVFIAQNNRAWS